MLDTKLVYIMLLLVWPGSRVGMGKGDRGNEDLKDRGELDEVGQPFSFFLGFELCTFHSYFLAVTFSISLFCSHFCVRVLLRRWSVVF